MQDKIYIFDTTLRDGEQTPGVNLNLSEKVEIALQLEKLGVDIIEAGFANSSKGDFAAISGVAKAIRNCSVCSLSRANEADVRASAEALKDAKRPLIHTFIATSDIHMQYKLKMSPEEVLERAVKAVSLAKSLCGEVEFSAEDATRSNKEFLFKVFEAVIKAGATVINIPDTVGYSSVQEFSELIDAVKNNVPNIDKVRISVHCHDDLGLAVANSLEAVRRGARQVECTINGLGERAGNAAMEEIVMGLTTRRDFYGATHDIVTKQLNRTSKLVSGIASVDVAINKAIIGANAFLHESGIHQHGILSERSTYEIMNPESIGIVGSGVLLGKLSGKHAFLERAKELGYSLSDKELETAFVKFKDLADRKKNITDRDIEALLGHQIVEIPSIYTLDSFQVTSGNKMTATATVSMIREGNNRVEASVGDGPINAAYNAIDKIVGLEAELESYGIKAITEGKDALGEVTAKIRCGDKTATGKGISTDIIEASILAYINAINRIISDVA